jgi:hypothetical protein
MIFPTPLKLFSLSVLFTTASSTNYIHIDKNRAADELSGSIKELSPAVHWDHNLFNLNHLVPGYDSQMYYADEGKASMFLLSTCLVS